MYAIATLALVVVIIGSIGAWILVRMVLGLNRQVAILRVALDESQDKSKRTPRQSAEKVRLRKLVDEIPKLLSDDPERKVLGNHIGRAVLLLESASELPNDMAEGLYREALAESEGSAGSTHWLAAVALNDLAVCLYENGEANEAWENIRLAVQIAAEWGEESCKLRHTIAVNLVTMIMVTA